MYNPLKLVGKTVVLEEIQPKFFEDVIRWRNDKELNQFLNQPFELIMKLEEKWFEKYVKDDTQGLLIMIDKKTQEPFGTIGWTDLDLEEKVCISGRLLVGNNRYKGRLEFIEAMLLYNEYLYNQLKIENMYAHIAKENSLSISFNKKFGYVENAGIYKYSSQLYVMDMEQIEYCRSKSRYDFIKARFTQMIDLALSTAQRT